MKTIIDPLVFNEKLFVMEQQFLIEIKTMLLQTSKCLYELLYAVRGNQAIFHEKLISYSKLPYRSNEHDNFELKISNQLNAYLGFAAHLDRLVDREFADFFLDAQQHKQLEVVWLRTVDRLYEQNTVLNTKYKCNIQLSFPVNYSYRLLFDSKLMYMVQLWTNSTTPRLKNVLDKIEQESYAPRKNIDVLMIHYLKIYHGIFNKSSQKFSAEFKDIPLSEMQSKLVKEYAFAMYNETIKWELELKQRLEERKTENRYSKLPEPITPEEAFSQSNFDDEFPANNNYKFFQTEIFPDHPSYHCFDPKDRRIQRNNI